MEFVIFRKVILLLLVWCLLLLMDVPHGEARRYRRSSYGSNTRSSSTNAPRPPGFTHYFVIVIIVFGCMLVFVCCFLNALRCLQNVLKPNKKRRVRRRPLSGGTTRQHCAEYQGDTIDQSELGPPPSYAEIIEESTAPPPAYSSLHVGDAGWAAQAQQPPPV